MSSEPLVVVVVGGMHSHHHGKPYPSRCCFPPIFAGSPPWGTRSLARERASCSNTTACLWLLGST